MSVYHGYCSQINLMEREVLRNCGRGFLRMVAHSERDN